jgi:hypothetical protein
VLILGLMVVTHENIIRIRQVVLASVGNVGHFPDLSEVALLDPCLNLMKIFEIPLVLEDSIEKVLLDERVADRIVLDHCL